MRNVKMALGLALVFGIGHVAWGQEASDAEKQQLKRDQLRIAVQQICPVSGNRLGQHGPPVKVTVGEEKEEVFLCCKGCSQGKIDPQHWATIHTNIAKTQGKCPVMNKPLPEKAKWTIVQGQVVYVCCPPCTKKVAADPETYLEKVDQLYVATLRARRASR